MRKASVVIALVLAVFLSIRSAHAYDTGGSFGMGLRIIGSPVVMTAAMKIGINDWFTLEPGLGFYELKTKYEQEYYDYSYDPYYSEVWGEYTVSYTDNILVLTLLGDFKPIRKERSNLVVKGGFAYSLSQSTRDYTGSPYDDDAIDGGRWNLALLTGLGVEHFFNDYFAVYSGWLAGFALFKDEDHKDNYQSLKGFGSQLLDFSLIWYLK